MPIWEGKVNVKLAENYEVLGNDNLMHVIERLRLNDMIKHYVAVLPKPNELQLDFDTDELPLQFEEGAEVLKAYVYKLGDVRNIPYKVTESSHGNRHVHIELPDHFRLDAPTRIAWQMALGSDIKRETASLKSHMLGLLNPIILIERSVPYEIDPLGWKPLYEDYL